MTSQEHIDQAKEHVGEAVHAVVDNDVTTEAKRRLAEVKNRVATKVANVTENGAGKLSPPPAAAQVVQSNPLRAAVIALVIGIVVVAISKVLRKK